VSDSSWFSLKFASVSDAVVGSISASRTEKISIARLSKERAIAVSARPMNPAGALGSSASARVAKHGEGTHSITSPTATYRRA
jgi:hypothetical protein